MDLDGDGFISMYEMEYFYEEQANKLEQLEIEPLPFTDCLCQVSFKTIRGFKNLNVIILICIIIGMFFVVNKYHLY